jgi:ferredoxin--NADP+ reductase
LYKITKKQNLSKGIDRYYIEAPLVAKKAKAGQFVIIRINEEGERIPLTIAGCDRKDGTISLVSMGAGKTTAVLSELKEGDSILDVAGPLGNPTEIENFGKVVCVGGGVGIAPILPIAEELKKAGSYTISIIGAKSKDMLILKDEMKSVSDELHVCTDDGSEGFHGFVSGLLDQYLKENILKGASKNSKNNITNIARVIAIGPVLMMASVAKTTRPYNLDTIVSLNSIMVDGTGMCGACRVEVGGKTKFVCVDGPEFDGHKVDFDLLITRQNMYRSEEKKSLNLYKEKCKCITDKKDISK